MTVIKEGKKDIKSQTIKENINEFSDIKFNTSVYQKMS